MAGVKQVFSLWFCLKILLTVLTFYAGREVGKSGYGQPPAAAVASSECSGGQTTSADRPVIIIEDAAAFNATYCTGPRVYDHCVSSPYNFDHTFLHLTPPKTDIPNQYFSFLHHPSSPAKFNFMITQEDDWPEETPIEKKCQTLYMTRTGSRASQPNKCVAVARVAPGLESIVQHSHRTGYTALLTNQYQADYSRSHSVEEEGSLLPPLLRELPSLIQEFQRKMGNPIGPDGKRRTAIVMVANEGVMDMVLNFFCSAEASFVDAKSVIVFVGTQAYIPLIEAMGGNAIYSPALGSMPANAAAGYLDKTFSRMMWFKTTSVFLALNAGFDVLFQDVDLTWINNPIPYLQSLEHDVSFMDDGARTPRYTPFFVNSGFYFMKHTPRSLFFMEKMMKCSASEIGFTHSHQSVLTRHIAEVHHLIGLRVFVLDQDQFPSGQAYHEKKKYIAKIQAHTYMPYVFHMCWTDNRDNKLVYFKEIGLWYVTERDDVCNAAPKMLQYALIEGQRGNANAVRNRCCTRERYWQALGTPPPGGSPTVAPETGKKGKDKGKNKGGKNKEGKN